MESVHSPLAFFIRVIYALRDKHCIDEIACYANDCQN